MKAGLRALLAAVATQPQLDTEAPHRCSSGGRVLAWALVNAALAGVVETSRGPVDVASSGTGPAVVVFHGAPGGSDQGALLGDLAAAGFRVLAISRPGYLDTPLSSGPTFADQGDLAVALLDALDIERAAAIGLSAGGPAALSMATRHPDRTWALVLEAAVVDAYVPSDLAENERLGRLILSPVFGGPTFSALRRAMHRTPERSARKLLAIESTLDEPELRACARQIAAAPGPWTALADSMVPFHRRRDGLRNDLHQLAAVDARAWSSLSVPTLLQSSPSDADVALSHAHALVTEHTELELVLYAEACGHLLWFGPTAEPVAERRVAFLQARQP